MTLAQLLPLLRERGIRVWVEDAKLRYSGPKGALTPELKSALGEHKETLLSVFAKPVEPIARVARVAREGLEHCPLPLSFAQQRLWFLEQLEPGSAVYNVPSAVRLTGRLDVEALRRTFEELVRRHEPLRTTFSSSVDGEPQQTIGEPPTAWDLPVISIKSGEDQEVERLAMEEARRPFSLETGPMLRTTLLRLEEHEHILLFTMHHIASDGWSEGVLVAELAALYSAYREGKPSPLPPLALQYADFAAWQRSPEQERALDRQTAYWRDTLRGAVPLALPTDRPRPPVQTSSRGALAIRVMPSELANALARLGQEHEATLFMTLLAAFNILLSRYSGQSDICVGTPIANRTRKETEPLIGFFVNTLVIRVDLSSSSTTTPPTTTTTTFLDVLARVRAASLGAYAHQEVPFERLVAEIESDRDLSRSPLFQVLFVLQNTPNSSELSLPDLTLSRVDVPTQIAKFDLSLSMGVSDEEGRLACGVEYNTDLFDGSTIEALLDHFEAVMRGAVNDPRTPIAELDLLTERERHELVERRAQGQGDDDDAALIHTLFERQVNRSPHAIAGHFGEVSVTYDELNRRANRLARHLQKTFHIKPEVLVGVCLERSVEMVIALLAILKAGGAYVPLDPAYPRARLSMIANDANLSLIITESALADVIHQDDRNRNAARLCLDTDAPIIAVCDDGNLQSRSSPLSCAYVIYTSGSTGAPKGVAIAHQSAVTFLRWACRAFREEELAGVFAVTSICFDLSVFELFAPLCAGGAIILARDALDIDAMEQSKQPITLFNTVPSAMREWLHAGVVFPTSVRVVNLAGEPLTRDLASRVYEHAPAVTRLCNLYGPTEDTTYSTIFEVAKDDGDDDLRAPGIGVPIDNGSAYVLDARLELVPIGVVGELWLAGDGLARGYLGQPALTADRFRPDPFVSSSSGRMYRTGDLARRRRDGTLECLGRVDFQVKVRGFRIELPEIEARLLEHPSVREAIVVLARNDAHGDKHLVAYVVAMGGEVASVDALRDHLAVSLPGHMVPAAYVWLDTLPTTANGKIDRNALPNPDSAGTVEAITKNQPRDALELRLVAIWEELLGRTPIGIRDSFFDLGGHSLLAVRLMARIRAAFGHQLAVATLFERKTIETLARLLRASALKTPAINETMGTLVAIQPTGSGSRPPLFCVHPAGGNVLCFASLAKAMGSEQPLYALQSVGHINGGATLDDTVEAMASRYVLAIRERQPHGPYHLLGYSVGGTIAYAMATELVAQGEAVSSLVLLDALAPSRFRLPLDHDQTDARRMLTDFAREHGFAVDDVELRALLALNDRGDEAMLHVLRAAVHANALPDDIDLPTMRRLLEIMTVNVRAACAYRPQPFATLARKVMLIHTAADDGGAFGWAELVNDASMTVHRVEGDHTSILTQPHVTNVVRLVSEQTSRRA